MNEAEVLTRAEKTFWVLKNILLVLCITGTIAVGSHYAPQEKSTNVQSNNPPPAADFVYKQLYLTDPDQSLDRIDPVATNDNTFSFAQLSEFQSGDCLLYTSPSPRDGLLSRMPSSA